MARDTSELTDEQSERLAAGLAVSMFIGLLFLTVTGQTRKGKGTSTTRSPRGLDPLRHRFDRRPRSPGPPRAAGRPGVIEASQRDRETGADGA